MVETRRSSSATKRSPGHSPKPSPPRESKRPKAEDPEVPPDPKVEKQPAADPLPAADHTPTTEESNPMTEESNPTTTEESTPPPAQAAGVAGDTPAPDSLVKQLEPLDLPKRRSVKGKAKEPWARLISQYQENAHLPIFGSQFTIGHSENCNLCLRDPTINAVLCKLKRTERLGASVAVLEISGNKGVVQINGKYFGKKSSVILNGGDEVVFCSSGKHAYIFQLVVNEKETTTVLPSSLGTTEALGPSVRGGDTRPQGFPPLLLNEPSSSDVHLCGNVCKASKDPGELLSDVDPSAALPCSKLQAFKDGLKIGFLNSCDIDVSFDNFPYYLSETTKNALLSSSYIHLECKDFVRYTTNISSLNQRILLCGPTGSEVYQEMLVKALVKHFGCRLLITSLLSSGVPSAKGIKSVKEDNKTDKLGILSKHHSSIGERLLPKRPASSVEADIVGSSAKSPQMLKQETSTASSRTHSFKQGERVKYVGQHLEDGYQSPRGPSYGYCGNVVQATDSLRLEYVERDEEKLAIVELFKVISEESKIGPLIVYIKELEKFDVGRSESSVTLSIMLDRIAAGVVVIGSYTHADILKEKSHPSSLFYARFGASSLFDSFMTVIIFLVVWVILAGAALGYWIVGKFVLSEEGRVDAGIAQFVKWCMRVLATVCIFQFQGP